MTNQMKQLQSDQHNIVLDIGYSSIEEDLNNSLVFRENGTQNIPATIKNYVEILKKAISVLELIKDTTEESACRQIEFVTGKNGDTLEVKGNPEILERYVGFGIASYENDDMNDANSDSSSEYNEYLEGSDESDSSNESDQQDESSDESDTPISNSSNEDGEEDESASESESESESDSDSDEKQKPIKKKAPRK